MKSQKRDSINKKRRIAETRKHAVDTLTFYRTQLGFKEPSVVLFDASIFYYLAKNGKTPDDIKDLIKDPTAVLCTTGCVLRELENASSTYYSSGDPLDLPIHLANLVELEGCLHGKEITAEKCIRTILGIYNSQKMFLATRINACWHLINGNPFIPIITVEDGGLVLKDLSTDEISLARDWSPTVPIEEPTLMDPRLTYSPDYHRLLKRCTFYGFAGEITVNDSESQFKAISEQLGPSQWPYETVKGFVINQLLLKCERYTDCDLKYIVHVYRDGWGDVVTLQAAADFFGVEIVVVNSSKKGLAVSQITPYGVKHPKKAIYLSCLSIGDKFHYNSLQWQPTTDSFPSACIQDHREYDLLILPPPENKILKNKNPMNMIY